jgi:beta-glucosidase/6-phospho-beta-glucosidase/beta-galactosidase
MLLLSAAAALASATDAPLPADGFPPDFKWGLGTASYQVEGAWNEDGRGLSIWDVFTGADGSAINPGMANGRGQTGNVGPDQYHKFEEDVHLLRALGIKSYRFSVSWPRLLPNGTLAGGINAKGVAYYEKLIDALHHADIEPIVDPRSSRIDPPQQLGSAATKDPS